MRLQDASPARASLSCLLVGWVALWGPWLMYPATSLRQNPLDLAEWATFLIEVRAGSLRWTPEFLRLSVALSMVGLAFGSTALVNRWLRGGVMILALVPGLLLMPPYPYFLQLWWSESYGGRFLVASIAIIGVILSLVAGRLSHLSRRVIVLVCALASAVVGVLAFLALRQHFEMRYRSPIQPGWGALLFVAALITVTVLEALIILSHRRRSYIGPVTTE